MNREIIAKFPRSEWSRELAREVDRHMRWHRFTRWLTWPFDWLVKRLEADSERHGWPKAHYTDWDREALIWRVEFLQGAGRWHWARFVIAMRWLLPLAVLVGLAIGLAVRR